jgi:hypothetical protein
MGASIKENMAKQVKDFTNLWYNRKRGIRSIMPVRKNKKGKLEYHRESPIIKKFGWDIFDVLDKRPIRERLKPEFKKSIEESEHSCSPEECPTCKDKSCINSYEDLIDEGDFKI